MSRRPGLYIQTNPLRLVAAATAPNGSLTALEYPLSADQAESLAAALARCAIQERERIAHFDAEFLAAAHIQREIQ